MDLIERTAFITEIAKRKKGGQLGKTAMMKLLHLLQEGFKVPLGYRFTLYNYGPYDSEVMSDIDFAESFGQISVYYDGPDKGYRIQPANVGQPVALLKQFEPQLNSLVSGFGALNARGLELRSTLLFLSTEFQDDLLIQRLLELKPKYSEAEVREAIQDIRQKKLID